MGLSGDDNGRVLLHDVCLPGFRLADRAEYAATRTLEAEAARFAARHPAQGAGSPAHDAAS